MFLSMNIYTLFKYIYRIFVVHKSVKYLKLVIVLVITFLTGQIYLIISDQHSLERSVLNLNDNVIFHEPYRC